MDMHKAMFIVKAPFFIIFFLSLLISFMVRREWRKYFDVLMLGTAGAMAGLNCLSFILALSLGEGGFVWLYLLMVCAWAALAYVAGTLAFNPANFTQSSHQQNDLPSP